MDGRLNEQNMTPKSGWSLSSDRIHSIQVLVTGLSLLERLELALRVPSSRCRRQNEKETLQRV